MWYVILHLEMAEKGIRTKVDFLLFLIKESCMIVIRTEKMIAVKENEAAKWYGK